MKRRVSVRMDERTLMLLSEMAEMCGLNMSFIIKYLIKKEIDSVLDEGGYIDLSRKDVPTGKYNKLEEHRTHPTEFDEDWYIRFLAPAVKRSRGRPRKIKVRPWDGQLSFSFE
ncbi:MAG: hypothetical protein LBS55_02295 [Prevotellaceae bacterium]|jgi:hypothetical protein|nr:hypothetical protein [Prevotellaceae bacterium]